LKRGFTLIEILTVLGVIALVTAIAFPVLVASKRSASEAKCASNLRQLWTASELYRADQSQTAEVGSIYEMGLPPQQTAASLVKTLNLKCTEWTSAPGAVNGYEYMPIDPEHPLPETWAEYTRRAGPNAVEWADWSHNTKADLQMVAFPKYVFGISISGSLLKRKAVGDYLTTVWWSTNTGEQ
jgi:prepilin-type N-terminal cleavage/methylation domain-containing protein